MSEIERIRIRRIEGLESDNERLRRELAEARHAMACPLDDCSRCASAYAELNRAIAAIDAAFEKWA